MKRKKTMIKISLQSFLLLIMFVVFIIIILVSVVPYLLSLIDGESDARINAILSIISNVLGGLIAGTIAYITAKYQVNKVEKHNESKILRLSITELKFINQELIYNLRIFNSASPDDSEESVLNFLSSQLQVKTWNSTNLNFVNYINNELLTQLFNYYDRVQFIIDNKIMDNKDKIIELNELIIKQVNNKIEKFSK